MTFDIKVGMRLRYTGLAKSWDGAEFEVIEVTGSHVMLRMAKATQGTYPLGRHFDAAKTWVFVSSRPLDSLFSRPRS